MSEPRPEAVEFASAWLRSEKDAGRQHGPVLLALPTALWRFEMDHDLNLRRYGTLRFVLDEVHDQLYELPAEARERAAIIVDYVESTDTPNDHYRSFLGGYAWKVYANALRYAAHYPSALDAARRSQAIFNQVGSLAGEAAKARLVEALILRELGDRDAALRIASECARIFRDYGDSEAYMQAQTTQALVLADSKRYRDAIAILEETALEAEKHGDTRSLAIALHNSAEYARALGDRVTARELDARALKHFEELGSTVDIPRIRWTEGLALADEGQASAAILQLYITKSEFLALGMNGTAAACGLDVVRIRYDRGEDVTSECAELVETFTQAGMVQPAIEALAYLREQARRKTISPTKIFAVRNYVRDAGKGPLRLFLPPPEEDET